MYTYLKNIGAPTFSTALFHSSFLHYRSQIPILGTSWTELTTQDATT